ncbi:MAG: cytochrome c maturation protein CcmE, partial [Bacteroidia bacterium]|nr:cytochrome c maturation protein CcmE [Bacteroidia bacterium]
TYASFSDAAQHPGSTFHVVGKLDISKPFIYDPQTNPNLFTFYMKDREGTECKVTLGKPKPDDFERSDQIVVIGSAPDNSDFQAKDVLMKCPSKYNDGKPQEKQGAM